MKMNKNNLTPLDIAGSHGSNETALVLIKFCLENFELIKKEFLQSK
jgi:hypothetical protein